MISFDEALQLTLERIQALDAEEVPLISSVGRVVATDLTGRVDSPSVDVSLKDGYAVISEDIVMARTDAPVSLRLIGEVAAGGSWQGRVLSGEAVRILSGAPIPDGADAVVSEEFTKQNGDLLLVNADAHPGRNILSRGSDVHVGEVLIGKGCKLNPPTVGLLAAAGFESIPVIKLPKVAILATGDEVIAPGGPLRQGQLYASNLVTLAAWCMRYRFAVKTFVAKDDETLIRDRLLTCLQDYDAVLTSGGAWSGERDLVVRLLDELGWKKIYHRVRIGPGKAVALGLYLGKPVFCLPGGPPSNHMAFLQLALPGLQNMSGVRGAGLPVRKMRLAETVNGQSDWTQFVHGRLKKTTDFPLFYPLEHSSRLQMMATADAIIKISEGMSIIQCGKVVDGQVFT